MMTRTRSNPSREMAAGQSSHDRLFDESWRTGWPTVAGNTLLLDLYETDDHFIASMAVPGVHEDQIQIRFENGVLRVSVDIPQRSVENARVLIQERDFGRYGRSIMLPQSVNIDQVEAHYENGVLQLTLPKAPEAQPKRIPIKTNGQKQLPSSS